MSDEKRTAEEFEKASHEENAIAKLHEVPPPPVNLSPDQVKKLYRKMDIRLVADASLRHRLTSPHPDFCPS